MEATSSEFKGQSDTSAASTMGLLCDVNLKGPSYTVVASFMETAVWKKCDAILRPYLCENYQYCKFSIHR